jgi:two-component sensor histidine kinase
MIRALMAPVLDSIAHPGRKNRMVLLVFATGAAVALHLGLLHLFLWRRPAALVVFVAPSFLFSGAIYALWRWVFPRLGGRSLPRQVALEAGVSVVTLGIVSLFTVELATRFLGAPSLFGAPTGLDHVITITPEIRQMAARMYALLPVVPTVLMALIGYHQLWTRILSLQDRERQLSELAATAQLAALRAQINPHFLFNSLNSIAQLIHADPDKAEACVERLADLFRYVLRRAEKDFVPLADELEMAEAYLDIERARFGDRLRVETHIEPRSLRQLIPNLVLQPLIENAVKHGVAGRVEGGTIRIGVRREPGRLEIAVENPFDEGAPPKGGARLGLANVRKRLHMLDAEDAGLDVVRENGRFRATLRLPLVEEGGDGG